MQMWLESNEVRVMNFHGLWMIRLFFFVTSLLVALQENFSYFLLLFEFIVYAVTLWLEKGPIKFNKIEFEDKIEFLIFESKRCMFSSSSISFCAMPIFWFSLRKCHKHVKMISFVIFYLNISTSNFNYSWFAFLLSHESTDKTTRRDQEKQVNWMNLFIWLFSSFFFIFSITITTDTTEERPEEEKWKKKSWKINSNVHLLQHLSPRSVVWSCHQMKKSYRWNRIAYEWFHFQ